MHHARRWLSRLDLLWRLRYQYPTTKQHSWSKAANAPQSVVEMTNNLPCLGTKEKKRVVMLILQAALAVMSVEFCGSGDLEFWDPLERVPRHDDSGNRRTRLSSTPSRPVCTIQIAPQSIAMYRSRNTELILCVKSRRFKVLT
jgi:hypothetical protein